MNKISQQVTKLEAARRQLQTAIELWFNDGDAVSIHTLAFAAYEIIHVISKKKNRKGELIWDSLVVKDEFRSEFNMSTKKHADFFKHANKDPEAVIDFPPQLSEMFIFFCLWGLTFMNERHTDTECAFGLWFVLHRPNSLTPKGHEIMAQKIPIEDLNELRRFKKSVFFECALSAWGKFGR